MEQKQIIVDFKNKNTMENFIIIDTFDATEDIIKFMVDNIEHSTILIKNENNYYYDENYFFKLIEKINTTILEFPKSKIIVSGINFNILRSLNILKQEVFIFSPILDRALFEKELYENAITFEGEQFLEINSKLISTKIMDFVFPIKNDALLKYNVYSGSNNMFAPITDLSYIANEITKVNITILEDVDFIMLDYYNRMFLIEELTIKENND